jgi:inosose dehydratase
MKLGYQCNTWSGVFADAFGIGSIKDAFYGNVIMPMSIEVLDKIFNDIVIAGFEGVEVFDGLIVPFEEKVEEFVGLLDKSGLKLVAVYTGANFIFKDILPEELFKIERVAKIAKKIQAEYIVLGGGALRHDGVREQDYEAAANGLDKAAEIVTACGLKSCYHPHAGTIGFTWEQLEKVMKFSSVHLCPDTAHIALGETDNLKVIDTFFNRINYVHLKDLSDKGFVELGEGRVPLDKIVALLKKKGYDGWLTVELDASDKTPLESAKISRAFLEKIVSS